MILEMQMPINENEAINQSFKKLDGPTLLAELVGRDFAGEYYGGFKYILSFLEDGSLEGKNDADHHDIGRWKVDLEKGQMSTLWEKGWLAMTTHVYFNGSEFAMYDINDGQWRTSIQFSDEDMSDIKGYLF